MSTLTALPRSSQYPLVQRGVALCVGATLALLAGCGHAPSAAIPSAAANAPLQVGIVTLAPQSLAVTTELPGRTSAYLIADVRPQVGGIVQQRLFKEGAEVKAGEALYQIDPTQYQAALDNAQATLAKAQANLAAAHARADRYEQLIKLQAISKQDYDDQRATVLQADADVQATKAALESARINLNYTRITAPIAGQVATSTVTPGALVTANQSAALTTVQQLNPIYVDVTRPVGDVMRLKRELASGQIKRTAGNKVAVKVRLEDGSEYAHAGVLEFTGLTVSDQTGSITMRAVVPNPDGDLLPGMFVRAVLAEGVNEKAVLAPQQGIVRDDRGNATAYVVNADGTVEQRSVQTGNAVGNRWLVTSGLTAGDHLIVQGTQKVKSGDHVIAVAVSGYDAPLPAAP